jgi:ribosomal protein S18 acetylase RimI-like enzyme
MRIRKLAPPDRDGIAAVVGSDGTFTSEEVAVAMELVDGAIARPGGDYRIFVALSDRVDDGESIDGYVCYGPTPMTRGTFDLYWIATHQRARGRGIASRLVETMEHELRGLGGRVVRIETSQLDEYEAARSFYARLAYQEVGRIRDFYKPGDDLVILAKRLAPRAAAEVPRREDQDGSPPP